MATYAILRLNWEAEKVNSMLLASIPARLAFFRDYHGESSYKLNIMDCLLGLYTGCQVHKWFTSFGQTKFPVSTNSHLDMNWIIPGVLLAFKDPTINRNKENRSVSKAVIKELKRCGIKVIVRLNSNDHNTNFEYYGKSYHPSDFKKEQFFHYDIPFRDVGTPTTVQAHQFVKLCERYGSGIAVHCHAGLGRTATMIGCYMIKHFNFTSRSVCGWLKLCRRGSVMGPQHFFLDKYQMEIEAMKKDVVEPTKISSPSLNGIHGRFSRNVIAPMAQTNEQQPQSIINNNTKNYNKGVLTRTPRKNNIIHIAPANAKLLQQQQQQQKKKDQSSTATKPKSGTVNHVEKVENIRSRAASKLNSSSFKNNVSERHSVTTTRPFSSNLSMVKSSKSILHPKLKGRDTTSQFSIQKESMANINRDKEPSPNAAKKPRKQITSSTIQPRFRRSTITSARKSQTQMEPMKSQASDVMLRMKGRVGSREFLARPPSSRIGVSERSKRDGKVIHANKSRIFGLINTVYSRQNI